ncbi:hypothetical protein A1O3_06454 [Capronia epimyces CBS 606.96]|uniref:Uncharacterized protein n=1 Tax=Capronia epimyces CBS 606.96 TaxID=1182542 RepID=W9Y066_9EURO|nr:uncharacterized protein A1O3_06454 [Capronia epimyces CBS 606.96]EXJ82641.1 hypothetical protein A1O3_06454 [Capronia epimyces CBS 606.96]
MANWRERGYVPDSDDEEDEGEETEQGVNAVLGHGNATTTKHSIEASTTVTKQDSGLEDRSDEKAGPSTVNHSSQLRNVDNGRSGSNGSAQRNPATEAPVLPQPSGSPDDSTAAMLEAELLKGLQTVQDILGFMENDGEDDNDSPLSSLPSSLGNSPRPTSPARLSAATDIRQCEEPTGHGIHRLVEELAEPRMRRSFRPRAPIQVHPYALEDARYRQTLKSRGLKPVPLQQIISQPHEASEQDSQGADTFESSQSKNSDTHSRPRSPASDKDDEEESQSPIRGVRTHNTGPKISLGDDLPDLSDILRGHVPQILTKASQKSRQSRKSRKAATDDDSRIFDLPDDQAVPRRPHRKKSPSFQIPPSPPRSHGTRSSQDGPLPDMDEYLYGDTTPTLLPTPLLSSDKQGMKRVHIETLSSDSEQVVISDESSAHSSATDRSEDESHGIQQMRRRIKGVLPASWLKLDVKKRDSNLVSRHQARSPVKPALEKGVAQRVSSSAIRKIRMGNRSVRTVDADAMLDTSSESDSDEPAMSPFDDLDGDVQMSFEGDVVEDNTINAMLAPRSRKAPSRRRRQQKTGTRSNLSAIRPGKPDGHFRHSVSRPAGMGSNNISRPNKRLKKRHQKPKMSILDAPSFQDKEIPRFLKIAGRRGRGFGKTRLQDPSKKIFQMATAEDTLDVIKELNQWTNQQKTRGHGLEGTTHHPLIPQPGNINGLRDDFTGTTGNNGSTQLTHLKQTTEAVLQRIHVHQAGPRSFHPERDWTPQDPPSGILEYFKPRQPQRSRPRSNQQLNSYTSRAVQSRESANVPHSVPSLVRRVPRPPPGRREPSGQPLGGHPTISATSDRQTRLRPSR